MQTVLEVISAHSQSTPAQLAMSDVEGNRWSYADLEGEVRKMAMELGRRGVQRGDRIALVMPDGPEIVLTFLAVSSICACAPLNLRYKKTDFDFYLEDLQAKAVILLDGIESSVVEVASERNIPVWRLERVTTENGASVQLMEDAPGDDVDDPGNWSGLQDIALILHTSGTTSRPKMVPLTQENLMVSAGNVAGTLELSHRDTGLVVMPLFHIHGLVGALLSSIHAGSHIVCTPGFDGEKFLEWARENTITWYSAVPTMHQAILDLGARNPEAAAAIHLRLIRSSSASLPPKVFKDLVQLWNAPVIESYGMTEASHQMSSNPMPPLSQKPGSVGLPAGPEVAVVDASGKVLDQGDKGPICIRGKNVTHGYLNNDKANKESFVNGWFQTGDEGYFDEEGYLVLTGRLKEMINRGGENIAPREIDEALLEHPSVAQATAFAVPHPSLSEDIAAAVVLNPGHEGDESELRAYLTARLADFKVPTRIVFVDSIPKGPTGKLQRIGLHEKLADNLKTPYLAPQSEMESLIVEIMEEILDVSKIGVNENFFFLGGDSIRASRIINQLNDKLSMKLPLISVFTYPTPVELGHYLEEQLTSESSLDALVDDLSKLSPEEIERLLNDDNSNSG